MLVKDISVETDAPQSHIETDSLLLLFVYLHFQKYLKLYITSITSANF